MKGQSATEYLMTYGWAILIVIVVAMCLYLLGVFNPETFSDDSLKANQKYMEDICGEYARQKYDLGYYYAHAQFNDLFNCFEGNTSCVTKCINYSMIELTCFNDYINKYNESFGAGYDG
ncbi:MAG: hypothetical protein V3W20_12600 [Candidatus Neomarinimicrobiota bacterium]